VPGQGNYWDYLILGRVLRPHQGDTVSPRRGLNDTGDILDVRKDVAADSQHKTAFYDYGHWITKSCPVLFLYYSDDWEKIDWKTTG